MFKDILKSRWFTVVILIVLGFLGVSIIKLELPLATVSKELRNLNQKIDKAKKTGLELEKLGDYLKSDAYLERQARLKLNYKKPDEKVVFVYTKTTETPPLRQMGLGAGQARKILDSKLLASLREWWGYLLNK